MDIQKHHKYIIRVNGKKYMYNGRKYDGVEKVMPDEPSRIGYCMEGGDTPCNK